MNRLNRQYPNSVLGNMINSLAELVGKEACLSYGSETIVASKKFGAFHSVNGIKTIFSIDDISIFPIDSDTLYAVIRFEFCEEIGYCLNIKLSADDPAIDFEKKSVNEEILKLIRHYKVFLNLLSAVPVSQNEKQKELDLIKSAADALYMPCVICDENDTVLHLNRRFVQDFGFLNIELTNFDHLAEQVFFDLNSASNKKFYYPVVTKGRSKKGIVSDFQITNIKYRKCHMYFIFECSYLVKKNKLISTRLNRIETVMAMMDELVYVIDPQSNEIIYVNDAVSSVLEIRSGDKCQSAVAENSAICNQCDDAGIFGNNIGKKCVCEKYNEKINKWYRHSAHAIQWVDGRWVRLVIASDISEQKIAQEALLTSELLHKLTINSLQDPVLVVDRELQISLINNSFKNYAKKLAFPGNKLVGMHVNEFFPFMRSQFTDEFIHVLEENRTISSEFVTLVSGEVNVLETRKIPICRGESVIGVLTIMRDITKRRIAESKMQESETKYRQLYSEMTEGMALHEIIYNDEGQVCDFVIEDVNDAFQIITGLSKADVVGRLGTEVYSEPDDLNYIINNIVENGESRSYECYVKQFDKYFHVSSFSPSEGKSAMIFYDISDKVMTELKNEKLINELKITNTETEQFTYAVSHDLKSPLITIKGFLGLIEQDIEEENFSRLNEDIQRVSNAADKMADLLNDLLTLSRLGRVENNIVEIDINSLISELKELLYGIISDKDVKIIATENMPVITGDYSRISEVFQNLIENGIKFSANVDNPIIEIGYEMLGDIPEFYVKDFGIGIETDYFGKIFGVFEKLDNSYSGTGIGLSVVKRICENHSGYIKVESEGLNKGTTFRFTFAANNSTD